jgi:hypothetical protein
MLKDGIAQGVVRQEEGFTIRVSLTLRLGRIRIGRRLAVNKTNRREIPPV